MTNDEFLAACGLTREWGLRIKYEDGTTKDRWVDEDFARGMAGSEFADVIIRYVSTAEVVSLRG